MLEFELAGPGSRFSAYAIDFILNVLLIAAIVILAYLTSGLMIVRALAAPWGGQPSISWLAGVVILIIFATNWGYYVFFEGFGKGSTPGKKRIGIRVIRDDGLPVGLREAALRNLVRAADMLPPPSYILGGLVMHFDRRGRRLPPDFPPSCSARTSGASGCCAPRASWRSRSSPRARAGALGWRHWRSPAWWR